MDHFEWIAAQINSGKTWEEVKNISKKEFEELRDYKAIIPCSVKYSDWAKIVDERKGRYSARVETKGLSGVEASNFPVPSGVSSCWRIYKESLKGAMTDGAVQQIEADSHWLLNQLARESGTRRGLVMGSVQSGKTANMVGLVSMAADYDWNFFIVLSGTIDNLRNQTRDRFKNDLKNTDSVQWHVLDYGRDGEHLTDLRSGNEITLDDIKLNTLNAKGRAEKYVMVCLKQSGRLERLIKWLHTNNSIAGKLRLVVIDDEADQASINTKLMENAVDEEPENDVERTRINQSIVNLVTNCLPNAKRSSNPIQAINYICYTATPYANILNEKIQDYSLYPSDFIYSLSEPKAYFGGKVIFGSFTNPSKYPGLNVVRTIGADDLLIINSKTSVVSMPPELEKALKWFFCASAIIRYCGQKHPISMLIHTSPKVSRHMSEYKLVQQWLKKVNKNEFVDSCKELYEEEIKAFTKEKLKQLYFDYDYIYEVSESLPEFSKISDDIKNLLLDITHISLNDEDEFEYVENGVHLCVDNCISQRYAESEDDYMRIVYPDKDMLSNMKKAPVFIIFGGNTLSRGLTIEGLVCTYFARNVTQADTLMQMARWFGYRKGYELLQRIWLPIDVQNNFKLLQRIDEELKLELDNFVKEKKSPKEFGPKVINSQSISKLKITSKNKMQAATERGAGYHGDAFETTQFKEEDLRNNVAVVEKLIKAIGEKPIASEHSTSSYLWQGVGYTLISEFLSNYRYYDDKQERILKVIDEAVKNGKFLNWNIAIVSGDSNSSNNKWEPWQNCIIQKSMRSKLIGEPDVNIARLRNSTDALCDVRISTLTDAQREIYEDARLSCRPIGDSRGKLGLKNTPLLLLYRIDKDAVKKQNEARESISTKEDIIAYAIIISGDGVETVAPTTLSIG